MNVLPVHKCMQLLKNFYFRTKSEDKSDTIMHVPLNNNSKSVPKKAINHSTSKRIGRNIPLNIDLTEVLE